MLITLIEKATLEAVGPLIVSREQIKALRLGVIQQRELHQMVLEKINDVAQHQVNQAETEIEHLLKMGKLEEKATGLFAKLSIRLTKIDDFIDKAHKIVDRHSENIFEIPPKDAAIEDLLNEI